MGVGGKNSNTKLFMNNIKDEKKWYILNQALSPNTKICRYVGFDVFLQLLGGKFYVPRKNSFLDARESGKIPLKYKFGLQIASNKNTVYPKTKEEKNDELSKQIQNLVNSRLLLTSCWAIDHGEDYLMWKSYTNDTIGVCVRTTIDKLMQAIEFDIEGYTPICSPVLFQKTTPNVDFMESMFSKEPFYSSEEELRIYFVPHEVTNSYDRKNANNEVVRQLLMETISHEEKEIKGKENSYPMSITFDFNPTFIESIVLSPFIKPKTFPFFQKVLNGDFADYFRKTIMINQSDISIKQ